MKTHDKTAELQLEMIAESGYEATAHYRISPAQWGDVLRVCEGDLSYDVQRERDLFREALVRMIGSDTRPELVKMRELIDIMAPEGDNKVATIGAINALLTTLPEGEDA